MLGGVLLSIHNIHYFQDVMRELRAEAEGSDAGGGHPR
jgi:queuine/archaeosine tRNA-ribosyltransferase